MQIKSVNKPTSHPNTQTVWGRLFLLFAAFGVTAGLLAVITPVERPVASYATTLAGRSGAQRHNAEKAVRALNGAVIAPGALFSFNDRVGSFTRDQGYRKAPVSYNGQLINSWGGGVCQASTTLYNTALLAGMKILERHRHQFAPSYVPPGRDAAVAFSNIDLKFRNPYDFSLTVHAVVENDKLVVTLAGNQNLPEIPKVTHEIHTVSEPLHITLGERTSRARIRNSGKQGCSVSVIRIWHDRKELISSDTYPAMNRILQYRS